MKALPPKSQHAILDRLNQIDEELQHVTTHLESLPQVGEPLVHTQEDDLPPVETKVIAKQDNALPPVEAKILAKCPKCGIEFTSLESGQIHEKTPCKNIPCRKNHDHGIALINRRFESKAKALSFLHKNLSSSIWYEKQNGIKFSCRAKKCSAKVKIIEE